jgi:hypothetical protein
MAASVVLTPYADLDELLIELLRPWHRAWCQDLEGSYAPVVELASVDHFGEHGCATTTAIVVHIS